MTGAEGPGEVGGEGRTASQVRQSGRLNERSLTFFLDSVLIPVCRVDRRRDGRAGHSGPPSGASPSWLCSPKILAPTRSTLRLRSLSAGPCGLPPPCSQGRRFPPEPTLRSDPGSPQVLNARVQPCHPALTPTSLTLSICSPPSPWRHSIRASPRVSHRRLSPHPSGRGEGPTGPLPAGL